MGDGIVMILDKDSGETKSFSKRLMCPTTGISYRDPAPNIFSFNSPEGACPRCKGLGYVNEIDLKKVIPDDSLSIHEGAIVPLGKYKNQMIFWQIAVILEKEGCTLKTPVKEIPQETLNEIMYGSLEKIRIEKELIHTSSDLFSTFDGVIKYLRTVIENDDSANGQKWADQFLATCECPEATDCAYRVSHSHIAFGTRTYPKWLRWTSHNCAIGLTRQNSISTKSNTL